MNITIIYNPVSTGDSEQNARDLQKKLTKKAILVPTESAGHAEDIAYDLAKNMKPVIIVASSGDGGYHETLNGVMRAGNKQVVAGTIPSGNANDHHRNTYTQEVYISINNGQFKDIDLIHVQVMHHGKEVLNRYAHSYVGLGISSDVAKAINLGAKHVITEKIAALRTFLSFKPFHICMDNKQLRLDNLLISNIPEMAKSLTVAPRTSANDGKLGVSMHHHGSRLNILRFFARSRISKAPESIKKTSVLFTVLKKTSIQMDGEVYSLPKDSEVSIRVARAALKTFA